jgi:hypothetical protein
MVSSLPPRYIERRGEDRDLDRMRRLRLLLLAGGVVLGLGCGLPDSFYLQPPTATGIGSGLLNNALIISGTTRGGDVDAVFQGYELYYKCYISTDTTTLLPDENYGTTSNTYTDLLTAGFHRVCRGSGSGGNLAVDTYPGTQNSPLIDISRIDPGNAGNNYTISIIMGDTNPPSSFNFITLGAPAFYFSYTPPAGGAPTAGWEIRRFVPASPNFSPAACSTFASIKSPNYTTWINWNATDADMTTTIMNAALGPGTIYVMFYAVSTGVGLDGTPRFSSPVWMGYTLMQILN